MNPYYENGIFCTGVACEPCHKCGAKPCSCNKCDKCSRPACACPEPFFGIDKVTDKTATYRFNTNGKTTIWSFESGIKEGQTDTSLVADIINRLLIFSAERHTDSISHEELGALLHLTDLGDVNTKGAEDGSMLVFKKSDTCPSGCVGTNNIWQSWNALDEQAQSAAYGYGFDSEGQPVSLQQPANPNQYYNLGWNGANQLSYAQPVEESAQVLDSEGYAYQMYINPATKQPYYLKVKP